MATVVTCVGVALMLLITGGGVHLGAAALARHRAESAADLAALAGAADALTGFPCARAADLAQRNGAELVSCAQDGLDIRVHVRVVVAAIGLGAHADGRARAGPE